VVDERKELMEKIKWLLFLRVVTLSFFLGATALFHFFKTQGDHYFLFILSVPLIAAYVISIGSGLLIARLKDLRLFAHLQVDFDVLLITGIIWITGDIASPFAFLYNLAVMNGAILLFYRGAFITAGFSSFCYVGLLFSIGAFDDGQGLFIGSAVAMPVVLNVGSFYVIACLSGFLASKLRETERLLNEKQLDYQELETLKETLLQGIGSGVAITDEQGRINYFNGQAQRLTSFREESVKGKKLDQIFPGLNYNFNGFKAGGRVATEEINFADGGGCVKQIHLTMAPLSSAKEELIGFVAIFEDITKQKEFEEKVRIEEELRHARQMDIESVISGSDDSELHFEGVIGKNGSMAKIFELIKKVANGNTNILIMGESGTGKELVARGIHFNGSRRDKPFIAVNCGAIPEALIESELFGHLRGAFTGAVADRVGLFKQADQGTIFLDEVGELPLHLQVKLLRVLQDKSFTPVGGAKQVKVDVRVISATNRDLRLEMQQGRFREDLYYRLNVVQMVMPPLRHRKEDIPILTHFFIRKIAGTLGKQVEEISSDALKHLLNYTYPGNVRELENIIEHAVAVTGKNILTEDDLPPHVKGVPITEELELFEKTAPGGADSFFNKGVSLDVELETHEKCILLGAMKQANGIQKRAAELLGINYRSLRHRLEKYDLLNTRSPELTDGTVEGQ
jgi:two-component system response regulator PilR (NtrC family)